MSYFELLYIWSSSLEISEDCANGLWTWVNHGLAPGNSSEKYLRLINFIQYTTNLDESFQDKQKLDEQRKYTDHSKKFHNRFFVVSGFFGSLHQSKK